MNPYTVRRPVVVLATLALIVVNALANALPLNGQATGEISDRFDILFVPAGYVFSIWGLIYIGLIAYTVYQARPDQRDNPRLRRVGYLYALSCVANIAWLFLWHYNVFEATLPVMLALLLLLIAIYLSLGIGRGEASTAERWLVLVPFSVYLGWITVAAIANVAAVLSYLKWDGWGVGPEVWAIVMMAVATAIAWAVSLTRRDIAFALVIAWALVGIAIEQADTPVVSLGAWAMTTLVAVAIAIAARLSLWEASPRAPNL